MEKTVTITKKEYKQLKEKAKQNDELLLKLIRGLEDIKEGRIKPWKAATTN